ncbi:serine carboxypeptidase [Xylariaceae sp. FL0016]|nr:serine carboxypeptidase [Xylariaceae sp. FL0016]
MRTISLAITVAACLWQSVLATPEDLFEKVAEARRRHFDRIVVQPDPVTSTASPLAIRANTTSPYLNEKSAQFVVNGTGFPEVDFDIGESYAGLLPISKNASETRKLFFWFFPSDNVDADNEIAAWFNGGPGCSSLSGFLLENGPFLWQSGTFMPIQNPYSWHKLTNYVWIEQPVGVGYTEGEPNLLNEIDLTVQFKGFWENFVDTFNLHGRDMYLTGESYAGFYVPYIGNSFIEANDTEYFNLKGIAINDPLIGNAVLQEELPLPDYVEYWKNLFYLNDTFLEDFRQQADECGYTNYTNTYFQFPPPAKPWPEVPVDCGFFYSLYDALLDINPCFNIYHVTDTCPYLYNHLGITNGGDYQPDGAEVYFNRQDVKDALNVPNAKYWWQCTPIGVFIGADRSEGPALDGTLTHVIETINNTIIGSGALDLILPTNGTLFAMQNLTWNGAQGFEERPSTPFYVPFHNEATRGAMAGSGTVGVWGHERGVTFYDIQLAGHEVPGYSAGGGYRSIELLLGRIESLSDTAPLSGI